jgi:SAM-dependent methyltransferase
MRSTDGYGENAKRLAAQYESITFEDTHRCVLHLFPAATSRILDIGAGSGRDAAALAALGHTVIAVEPTAELRDAGRRLHVASAIAWVDDMLPDLDVVRGRNERYDVVLLTAVWMHLDADERRLAMARIADLLVPRGIVIMSLRHGPVPAGRRMFEVSATETIALAASAGLRCIHESAREDMFGRANVSWTILALQGDSR